MTKLLKPKASWYVKANTDFPSLSIYPHFPFFLTAWYPVLEILIYSYSLGFAAVKQNDKWGLIDKEGNFVLKPKYESFVNYREGLDVIYMTQKNKSVYIDSKGNELFKDLKSNYSLQYYEENGLAVFNKDPYDL